MKDYPSFFSPEPPCPAHQKYTPVTIEARDTLQSFSYDLLIDAPNTIIVRGQQKSEECYKMNLKVKMEPVYNLSEDQKLQLQVIKFHMGDQQLTLRVQKQNNIEQIYRKLKRCLSHKGFSQYFKPIRRLGKGAFATVYLIQSKKDQRRYAAKVFSREGQKLQFKGKESLENEIKILKMLDHPNVSQYEGLYQTQNLIYLVTEYISGGTLQEFMRDKLKLRAEVIIQILSDALTALAYLQQKKIMHRDLKPENILLRSEDNRWVLVDFGLSACLQDQLLYETCGTMGYIAPQLVKQPCSSNQHTSYNSACDLYSLGVIAYELIVGSLPFKVETEGVLDKKIVWNGFSKEQFKILEPEIGLFLQSLLQSNPVKRLTPLQALNSSMFKDKQVQENWGRFCQKKIDDRYDKILKMANCN